MLSHPSWVCGLKHEQLAAAYEQHNVTSFVGVWIETNRICSETRKREVTSFVGVWIETTLLESTVQNHCGHILRGCVD